MIPAEELYKKIKAKYPDFEVPKAEPNDFSFRPDPPLTPEQLELLEAGFDVKPSYDPRHYPDSHFSDEYLDKIIEQFSDKTEP